MKIKLLGILLLSLLLACGGTTYQNGSRITHRTIIGSDGVIQDFGLYDTQLQMDCSFRNFISTPSLAPNSYDPKITACYPVITTPSVVYEDSGCSKPIVVAMNYIDDQGLTQKTFNFGRLIVQISGVPTMIQPFYLNPSCISGGVDFPAGMYYQARIVKQDELEASKYGL